MEISLSIDEVYAVLKKIELEPKHKPFFDYVEKMSSSEDLKNIMKMRKKLRRFGLKEQEVTKMMDLAPNELGELLNFFPKLKKLKEEDQIMILKILETN